LNEDNSIHDSLQDIIDEKLQKHDHEEHAARKARDLSKLQELSKTRPDLPSASPSPLPSLEKPLPTIILSPHPEKEDSPPTSRPPNQVVQRGDRGPKPESIKEEADMRRKERLEEERRLKKAERERWRKSEQEFIQLPEATIEDEEVFMLKSNDAKEMFLPIIHNSTSSHSLRPVPLSHDDVSKPAHAVSKEDQKIAKDLHYQLQKELEAEDDRQALLLAAKMQQEWETEEEETQRRAISSGKGGKRNFSPDGRSDVGLYGNDKGKPPSLGNSRSIQVPYPTYTRSNSPSLKPRQSPS
jgi:hypothetical protein